MSEREKVGGENDLEKRLVWTRLGPPERWMRKYRDNEIGDRDPRTNLLFFTNLQRRQRLHFF